MKKETVSTKTLGFVQLLKYNADTREFSGVMASSRPDQEGEIMDWESSKPFFKSWMDETRKRSKGKSIGNVREMHQLVAVGRLTTASFDDKTQKIHVRGTIDDDRAALKVEKGVYTGLSIGGGYAKMWHDPDDSRLVRYTARPAEVSFVDNPCNLDAELELVKAGKSEMITFHGDTIAAEFDEDWDLAKADRPEDKSDYAYAPGDNKSDWKFPIDNADRVRNALARWGQHSGIPQAEEPKVYARIVAAAKKFGIKVGEKDPVEAAKVARATLQKHDWPVDQLASIASAIQCAIDYATSDDAREALEELRAAALLVLSRGAAAEAAEDDEDEEGDGDDGNGGDNEPPAGADVMEAVMSDAAKTTVADQLLKDLQGMTKKQRKQFRKSLGIGKQVAKGINEAFNSPQFAEGLVKASAAVIKHLVGEPEQRKGAAMDVESVPDLKKVDDGAKDPKDGKPFTMPDGREVNADAAAALRKALSSGKLVTDPNVIGYRTPIGHTAL